MMDNGRERVNIQVSIAGWDGSRAGSGTDSRIQHSRDRSPELHVGDQRYTTSISPPRRQSNNGLRKPAKHPEGKKDSARGRCDREGLGKAGDATYRFRQGQSYRRTTMAITYFHHEHQQARD